MNRPRSGQLHEISFAVFKATLPPGHVLSNTPSPMIPTGRRVLNSFLAVSGL